MDWTGCLFFSLQINLESQPKPRGLSCSTKSGGSLGDAWCPLPAGGAFPRRRVSQKWEGFCSENHEAYQKRQGK